MNVVVDYTKCAGLGICESLLPGMFEVGADGRMVLLSEDVIDGERDTVEDAVAGCPTNALRLAP